MIVMKFGGTSVGSAQRMHHVANLVKQGQTKRFVVLSAMSGTTNKLVEISDYLLTNNKSSAQEEIAALENSYEQVILDLLNTEEKRQEATVIVNNVFALLRAFIKDNFDARIEKAILGQGEILSTNLFSLYLSEQRVKHKLLSALDFMRLNEDKEPDLFQIEANLAEIMPEHEDVEIFITQGFICRNTYGEIDNLRRGGSDYSASIIGGAINAKEIQIWTDIDGMHNNDPRVVEHTKPIEQLSYDEAGELAYFGAKILHPSSVLPARLKNIKVRLLNTMDPEAKGTTIGNLKQDDVCIKAVAAKEGITAIKIRSGRMLMAYGFLRAVFEIFERYKTPIDLITTSEVAISVTIDDNTHLDQILKDLRAFGTVVVDENQAIICVVGNLIAESKGFAGKIVTALEEIPVRMITYGGSSHNVSFVINGEDRKQALQVLNKNLFNL